MVKAPSSASLLECCHRGIGRASMSGGMLGFSWRSIVRLCLSRQMFVHCGRRHVLMSLLPHMRHKAKGDCRRWQRCHLVPIRVNRESVLCSISKNIHIDSPTMLCLTAVLRRCFCSVSSSCPIASDTNLRSLWKRNLYSRRSLVTRSRGLVAGIVRSRWRPVTVVKRAGQAP